MRLAAAALAALALAASPGASAAADPGVTARTILIGGTVPLSGEAAAFGAVAPGAKAYFDYVNARGGVNGRTIRYVYYDDGYDPSRTVELTKKLVEQDKVFAIFDAVGTANNLAIRPYLNQLGVPQLFSGDGSVALGSGARAFPWTMGFLPSYRGEGAIYGRTIVATRPKARIAVLYENTEYGRDPLRGLEQAIAGRGPQIVAKESYEFTDVDVASRVAQLKASGADTFVLLATPKFAIQSFIAADKLGWRPQVYVSSVSIEPTIMQIARLSTGGRATKNALSIAFVKNPNDPLWAKDPAVALYRQVMKRYAPGRKASDVYHWYGMTVAWTMVETLRKAGRDLTRAGLMKAARSLDTTANPFLLPGIRIRTSATDNYPLDAVYLYRYDNRQWVKASGLLPTRG